MNELWVARDGRSHERYKRGRLRQFDYRPNKNNGVFRKAHSGSDVVTIPEDWFPDLAPGECRRLVMAEVIE